ncbi:P-loop containing nucleoside triphosphate hydrolase protein [Pavlovales sp. CCMP2436]|nr:P-loop containing nucleoside triphosphate hydrolase protein [Pavlovales sp. CCMP2436]
MAGGACARTRARAPDPTLDQSRAASCCPGRRKPPPVSAHSLLLDPPSPCSSEAPGSLGVLLAAGLSRILGRVVPVSLSVLMLQFVLALLGTTCYLPGLGLDGSIEQIIALTGEIAAAAVARRDGAEDDPRDYGAAWVTTSEVAQHAGQVARAASQTRGAVAEFGRLVFDSPAVAQIWPGEGIEQPPVGDGPELDENDYDSDPMVLLDDELFETLVEFFPYREWSVGQLEDLRAIMDGKDLIAAMPTGGGKTLLYTLPPLTPTWKCMHNLTVYFGAFRALCLGQAAEFNALQSNGSAVSWVGLTGSADLERSEARTRERVGVIVVDEADIVAIDGHQANLRFDMQIPDASGSRPDQLASCVSDVVGECLSGELGYTSGKVMVYYNTIGALKSSIAKIERAIRRDHGNVQGEGSSAVRVRVIVCHAKLDEPVRTERERLFSEDAPAGVFLVFLATDVIGRGLNALDVVFVVHDGMPVHLSQYVQRNGRAGRRRPDGRGRCIIFLHGARRVPLQPHVGDAHPLHLSAPDDCCDNCARNSDELLSLDVTTAVSDLGALCPRLTVPGARPPLASVLERAYVAAFNVSHRWAWHLLLNTLATRYLEFGVNAVGEDLTRVSASRPALHLLAAEVNMRSGTRLLMDVVTSEWPSLQGSCLPHGTTPGR